MSEDLRERLEEGFKLHNTEKDLETVFRRGSVIAVFWHENLGLHPPLKFAALRDVPPDGRTGPGWLSRVDDGIVYSHKRRLVIVNHRRGSSIVIPITSYGGKGLTSKSPPRPSETPTPLFMRLATGLESCLVSPNSRKTQLASKSSVQGKLFHPALASTMINHNPLITTLRSSTCDMSSLNTCRGFCSTIGKKPCLT